MPALMLGKGACHRSYAGALEVKLVNWFLEGNPTNLVGGDSLVTRLATALFAKVGKAKIRGLFSQPGAFGGDTFVASGTELYRVTSAGVATKIQGSLSGTGWVSMAVVTGKDYEHLFVTDGTTLWYYYGLSRAYGILSLASSGYASTLGTTVVNVGGIYYTWTTAAKIDDDETSDGTSAHPYLLLEGDSDEETLANLAKAINYSGIAGTNYTARLRAETGDKEARNGIWVNESTHYIDLLPNKVTFRARGDDEIGTVGNSIATTLTGGLTKNFGTLTVQGDGGELTFGSAVIKIGTTYYTFGSAYDVSNDDSSAGTETKPYIVFWGGNDTHSLINLAQALMGAGTPGTTYTSRMGSSTWATCGLETDTTAKNYSGDLTATSLTIHARQNTDSPTVATTVTGGYARAKGTLTVASGAALTIAVDDRVVLGGVSYKFADSDNVENDVETKGKSSDPWLVRIGSTNAECLSNLALAINKTGTAGTTYHKDTKANKYVCVGEPYDITDTVLTVRAKVGGTAGNSIAMSTTSSAIALSGATLSGGGTTPLLAWGSTTLTGGGAVDLTWSGTTFTGGGAHTLLEVYEAADDDTNAMQNDDDYTLATAEIWLTHLTAASGYILGTQRDGEAVYFIPPGEWYVGALNYVSAESEPDRLVGLLTVGDTVWAMGQSTCEAWYATGNADAPFARNLGRTISCGAIEGTAVKIKDTVLFAGTDNRVYTIANGLTPVSYPGIDEMIRKWREE